MAGRIICIVNFKGGVGKTVTAVNLSAFLAYQGKRTLLADMDPQASATFHFWHPREHRAWLSGRDVGIAKMLYKTGKDIETDVHDYIRPAPAEKDGENLSLLDILPGDHQLSKLDRGLRNRPGLLEGILRPLRDEYDYIVIDSPPVLYSVIINNILASDYYLAPTVPDMSSTAGIRHLLETLNTYFTRYDSFLDHAPPEFLGVLFTRYGGLNKKLHEKYYEEVRREFLDGEYEDCGSPPGEDRVLQTVIRERSDAAKAADSHLPLVLYDKNSEVAVDYLRLTREVRAAVEGEDEAGGQSEREDEEKKEEP